MVNRSIEVLGLVQGGSYRYSTQRKALELNICGTVQNLSNGNVYIEAVGSLKNMDAFIEWCHHGPSAARVDKIKTKTLDTKSFSSFEILRS